VIIYPILSEGLNLRAVFRILREAIRSTLQSNKPDPRLKDPASKSPRKKKR
jgi:hypothetical protein